MISKKLTKFYKKIVVKQNLNTSDAQKIYQNFINMIEFKKFLLISYYKHIIMF